ncbi:MAG TPA: hypothetical protein VFG04_30885 [Planctomycetaceae bacterium]|jgi:hypothetical protein|nr:hypothetical protein [Planctomycetaceae bacterium]
MDSRDLTSEQARIVCDRLIPCVQLLHKWQRRMRQVGFPNGDALLLATDNAYESAAELTTRLHQLTDKTEIVFPPKPDRRRRGRNV